MTFEEIFAQSYPSPDEVAREAMNQVSPTPPEEHEWSIFCHCRSCELVTANA